MSENYNAKVVFGDEILMDLTSDTVTKETLLFGVKAHGADGAPIEGTCTFDSDTTDANAKSSEILATRTAYVNKTKITGTMPNRGSAKGTISSVSTPYHIEQGYHEGGGTVDIDADSKGNLISTNIRQGISILGVTGSMTGAESVKIQANKDVTPSREEQIVKADEAGAYLAQVTVKKIPFTRTTHALGGDIIKIG
jgi:hypothetical protein